MEVLTLSVRLSMLLTHKVVARLVEKFVQCSMENTRVDKDFSTCRFL